MRLAILILLALPGPSASAAPAARQGPWNVILVVLDTVRADHTSPYGYRRDTTPALSELARRGVVFDDAAAQSDWTLPAFASMFTGERPSAHGVFRPLDRLPASERTLAQSFQERGFRTAAFSAGILNLEHFGLGRGFQTVRGFQREGAMGSLDQSLPEALSWLARNSAEPFFLVIHGADAHYPYVCPKAYARRFAAPQPAAGMRVDAFFIQTFNLFEDINWREIPAGFLGKVEALKGDPAAMSDLRDQYDGCLSYGDSRLPELFAAMTRLGLWENTILIATADHGEELGEHGGYGHFQRPLYQEVTHVPLILRHPGLPGRAGQRVSEPVEEIDLLPTLMDLEGWPVPSGVQGRSFKAALEGGRPAGTAGRWAQAARRCSAAKVLDFESYREGDWKLVRDGGGWSLFDLSSDPREERDLRQREPSRFLRLAEDLLRLKTRP